MRTYPFGLSKGQMILAIALVIFTVAVGSTAGILLASGSPTRPAPYSTEGIGEAPATDEPTTPTTLQIGDNSWPWPDSAPSDGPSATPWPSATASPTPEPTPADPTATGEPEPEPTPTQDEPGEPEPTPEPTEPAVEEPTEAPEESGPTQIACENDCTEPTGSANP